MIGSKFNSWTIIGDPVTDKHWVKNFPARCECGTLRMVRLNALVKGITKSCGCSKLKKLPRNNKDKIFKKWKDMMQRCYKHTDSHKNYRDRGIKVCAAWHDYSVFNIWAKANGFSQDLQIDRINNDGDYSPENCRFITRKQNCNNRSTNRFIEFNSQKKTLSQWQDVTGINQLTIRNRIVAQGWSVERSLTEPVKKSKRNRRQKSAS